MIIMDVMKYSFSVRNYVPHRKEEITEDEAKKIIDMMTKKPIVEGFYQYSFKLGNRVFGIFTLIADLKGFINATNPEKPTYGGSTNSGKTETKKD